MSDERVERELRDWMAAAAPTEVPSALLERARRVADAAPRYRRRWLRPRRWAPLAAVAAAVAVMAFAVLATTAVQELVRVLHPSPTSVVSNETPQPSLLVGVIPWIDATPAPTTAPEATPDPMALPICTAADLALVASGWGGATGSLVGGGVVVNLSSNTCRVGGKPAVELLDGTGRVIAGGGTATSGALGEVLALPPAGVAIVGAVWTNWCGQAPSLPLSLQMDLPDGAGRLTGVVRLADPTGAELPRCDAHDVASTIGVPLPFTAPEPSAGGYEPRDCSGEQLTAYVGEWDAAAGTSFANLVLINVGAAGTAFDCRLPTAPVLELRDAAGRLLAVAQPEAGTPSTILLPPAWAAVGQIAFADWCVAPPALPLRIDAVIGADRIDVAAQSEISLPSCGSAPQTPPPTFALEHPLSVPESSAPHEPDPCDALLPVSVTVSSLPTGHPGETLTYLVTLANRLPFDKPVNPVAYCPTYTERLFLPGSVQPIDTRWALNWPSGDVIPAGASATFEMRLDIPVDAAAGTATLIWQLGAQGPGSKVTFQIGS